MSPCADIAKIRLPWFRVHIVILNDPGRLISVHIMHSGLAAGWSGAITFYELITLDPTDPVYNPIWRQGCYGMFSLELVIRYKAFHQSLLDL